MKHQYTLFALLIVTLSIILGGWSAIAASRTDLTIPVDELYEVNSCTTKSNIYLYEDNDTDGKADVWYFLMSNLTITGDATDDYSAVQLYHDATSVEYYMPLPNMVYKIYSGQIWPIDQNTFYRGSWAFPYNTPILWIATSPNKIVFERPEDNDTGKNTISFIYNYGYKKATGKKSGTSTSEYRYNQISNISNTQNIVYKQLSPNYKREWWPLQYIKPCQNYIMHRCGDGKKDTRASGQWWTEQFTWELCDDGPLNGTAWYCVAGCGNGGSQERCGDERIQTAWTPYNWDVNNISFEECDDWDEQWDTDGLLNGDDAATSFCSTICLPTFAEEFTEEFVNE